MSENENGSIEETQAEKNNTSESSIQAAESSSADSSTPSKENLESSEASVETSTEEVSEETSSSESDTTENADSNADQNVKIDQFIWNTDPEHNNAVGILSETVAGVDVLPSTVPSLPSRALNFILTVMILAVGAFGFVMLEHYSSKDREARLTEEAVCKVDYDVKRQLLAQKQYGELRIETDPPQAIVSKMIEGQDKDFKVIMGKTSEGKEMHALTPTPIKNLDINQHYTFQLELVKTLKRKRTVEDEEDTKGKKGKKGKKSKKSKKTDQAKEKKEEKEQIIEELKVAYRTETFHVDRYQWIQDGATGSFRFQKVIKMTPAVLEEPKTDEELAYSAYYSFDWKSKKDMTFKSLNECKTFVADSKTDATLCRPIPFVKNFETEDTRKEDLESNKGKRR
jgi:hypothetical protein